MTTTAMTLTDLLLFDVLALFLVLSLHLRLLRRALRRWRAHTPDPAEWGA